MKKIRLGVTKYILAAAAGLLLTMLLNRDAYAAAILSRMFIAAMMAAGLDLCVGLARQLSLGQAAFMAAGAYGCGTVALVVSERSLPGVAAGLTVGVAAASVTALAVGAVVLRLKGDYLAVATLGLGEIVRVVLENCAPLGGAAGLYHIPRFTTPELAFAAALLCGVFGLWFARSRNGVLCRAMGQDEIAAASIGINPMCMKLLAFTLGAAMTGLAGGLYAGLLGFISPKDFTFARSVDILAAVVIGGAGTTIGPMLAAMLIEALSALLQGVANIRMILYAVILIVVTIIKYTKGGRRRAPVKL
ncbi:branched-chain amino acid ABC transporter permease [Acetanaerobacterium elongatum]|nr:branched-chain amino acid ABC transporter permease [Acetanaerobacterium elongatum]